MSKFTLCCLVLIVVFTLFTVIAKLNFYIDWPWAAVLAPLSLVWLFGVVVFLWLGVISKMGRVDAQ